jgi:nicotinamide-nucleotide amidase
LEAKTKFFKIPPAILRQTQGVSRKITSLLARRVKNILNTDVGAALTGFAGPAGKNVGQVFLSVSYRNKTSVKKVMIKGSRDKVRKEASMILIEMIYNQVGAGHARPVKK